MTLRLTAAWMYALGDRAVEVFARVDPIAADKSTDSHLRFEAALIGAAAAFFCDQPGLVIRYFEPWAVLPASAEALHVVAYANCLAIVDLVQGATQQLRTRHGNAPRHDNRDGSMKLAAAYSDVMIGLSYLWEGRPARAEELLQLAVEQAERDAGRRSVIAAMLAAVLSGAVLARNQPARARALLANRLDVIERIGTPDAILVAYRTLSDLALDEGDERQALDALGSLRELGERRRIPRMAVISLGEQIRIHAIGSRPETAMALLGQLESIVEQFEWPELQPWQPYCRMKEAIARAYAAMAAFDDAKAELALQTAAGLAESIRCGRETIIVKGLQAVLMHRRRPSEARAKLEEARDLASINGLERLIRELHPLTAEILGEVKPTEKAAHPIRPLAAGAVAVSGGLLTTKETEVLRLLSNGLSNKLIARSMDIGEETVKWHLKNLFLKLNAGTRRHAVDRARLLGLVA